MNNNYRLTCLIRSQNTLKGAIILAQLYQLNQDLIDTLQRELDKVNREIEELLEKNKGVAI